MVDTETAPKVFLSHASEDHELAERLATVLERVRLDMFLDAWEISLGQSYRERIDEGLAACTHFVVLLTSASVSKPWVKAEIDVAIDRQIKGHCKVLPVRYNLSADDLPPLLARLRSPQITEATFEEVCRGLIGAIYGISEKPPLGPTPEYVKPMVKKTGFSLGGQRIAHGLATQSKRGKRGDPELTVQEILDSTSLTIDELAEAVDELEARGLVEPMRVIGCPPLGYCSVRPQERLFIELDPVFMSWNPKKDAVRLAAELVNSSKRWLDISATAQQLDWAPRRMNPALYYLIRQGAVLESTSLEPVFVTGSIAKNNRTARFLRERQ